MLNQTAVLKVWVVLKRGTAGNWVKTKKRNRSSSRIGADFDQIVFIVINRGGVEDTRLEAKAKDTKKIRGQGQPFRGQTLSRPRTGMLEAMTKDTAASVLQKKGLQKSFSGSLQFIGVARIFDWGGLNHKSHAMTSSKICLLALKQDFAKEEALN